MAELVEIFRTPSSHSLPSIVDRSEQPCNARLIPGCGREHFVSNRLSSPARRFSTSVLPASLRHFDPPMLPTAALDLVAISGAFLLLSTYRSPGSASVLAFYLAAFFAFALQEGLYRSPHCDEPNRTTAVKILAWTTISCTIPFVGWQRGAISNLFLWSALNVLALSAMREVTRLFKSDAAAKNVLLVTDHPSFWPSEIIERLRPFRHVKHVVSVTKVGPSMGSTIRDLVREKFVDEILVYTDDCEVFDIVMREARATHVDLHLVPQLFGLQPAKVEQVNGLPLVGICNHPSPHWSLAFKRFVDLVVAGAACFALSPFFALIALAIRADSRGPVFYRSQRVGRGGRRFTCYKFRTMIPDADRLKDQLRNLNERQGAFFKMNDDPRVTRIGKLLRRYSLDELPQLWNVLCGDMSLVGPRPHPPDDVERYQSKHLQRLDFVPGITGLWQVTARGDPSFDRAVALDVEYIKQWSLALDFRILMRTIPSVLLGSGV